MYLRYTTIRKNGKVHKYWRLVRSVRRGSKVRQETVAQLGELDAEGRVAARELAQSFGGVDRQRRLFEEEPDAALVQVDVGKLRLERNRRFGDVWVAWKVWQALGLDEWLAKRMPRGREDIPWDVMAAVLVIARLCEPSSELQIAEDWYRRTSLDDLLGLPEEKVNDDRLYRALDRLLPHKNELEQHIRDRLGSLFKLDYDLLLYDVTSTYFEGQATANELAARGHSRDHRSDCKQVCIGLVVTREGYPLGYEIFPGNKHDSTTVKEIVERMEQRYGSADRIWVLDRGMVSDANLSWLQARKSRYIVGTPKSRLKNFDAQLLTGKWSQVREGLEVQLVAAESGQETFILCRSQDRVAKERAMRERFEARMEKGLSAIQAACEKRSYQVGMIERRIGRLLAKNSRATGLYEVKVTAGDKGQARLTWSKKSNQAETAKSREGCYVLRSNVNEWSAEELWRAYIQLTEAEAAFRIQKDELQLRPVWHQKTDRVKAHILICFLAYVLRKTLEGWSKRAGLGSSVTTLMEEFARIDSTDVALPTCDGRTLKIRCVVRPDQAQATLLDRLGLELPQRLRPLRGMGQM